jgi:hypothetical protein
VRSSFSPLIISSLLKDEDAPASAAFGVELVLLLGNILTGSRVVDPS